MLTAGKSPLLAALITIPFPGFGHFYCGAWGRGLAVMAALYLAAGLLSATGSYYPTFVGMPVLIGLASRDAWLRTVAENRRETAEAASGEPSPRWLLWSWAACRTFWITLFPLAFGVLTAAAAIGAARRGGGLLALTMAAPALCALLVAAVAARHAWQAVSGSILVPPRALRSEIGATAVISGVIILLAAIALPGFSGLFRKSAEGAMKGNLGAIRQAIENYRRAHDGRAPESLEALVGAGDLTKIPTLWPRFSGIAHPTAAAATVVSEAAATDSGRWAYVVSASSPSLTGALFIDCTHTDTRGSAWTSY